MTQAIQVYIVNLARRSDRLERLGGQLRGLGIAWQRVDALDAKVASEADLAAVISADGPLGRLGNADRACTISHMRAWSVFLAGRDPFALILEDDIYLAQDAPALLASTGWIPPGVDVVKLEKFGDGASTLLLGPAIADVPGAGGRHLHRMYSRHVGGGAYLISRVAAEAALALSGELRVPVDHLLFNGNVSAFSRKLRPALVRPAMATQRHYGYNSDVAAMGKAVRPKGWRRRARSLKRAYYDLRLLPAQLALTLTARARPMQLAFEDAIAPSGWSSHP